MKRLSNPHTHKSQSSVPAPAADQAEQRLTADPRQYLDGVVAGKSVDKNRSAQRNRDLAAKVRPSSQHSQEHGDKRHIPALDGGRTHDPSLKYARRARHKTREDRYEYKGHEDVKRIHKIAGHNKRSARRKSGAALNEEFQAPNVGPDRLTLQHATGPGFLSKGKSSNLTARRGIPDLTFSEMAFLNKRRDLDDARLRGYTGHGQPKNIPRGSAKDVSEFFALPAHPNSETRSDNEDDRERSHNLKPSYSSKSPSRSDRRKALSQFSQDRHNVLGGPRFRTRVSSPARTRHPDIEGSLSQQLTPGYQPTIESGARDTTSGVTWSPSIVNPQIVRTAEETLAKRSLREEERMSVETEKARYPAYTVHPRSSVSNICRDQSYRSTPRPDPDKKGLSEVAGRKRRRGTYYSLDDLRHLASTLQLVDEDPHRYDFRQMPVRNAAQLLVRRPTPRLSSEHRDPQPMARVSRSKAPTSPMFSGYDAYQPQHLDSAFQCSGIDGKNPRALQDSVQQNYHAPVKHHTSRRTPDAQAHAISYRPVLWELPPASTASQNLTYAPDEVNEQGLLQRQKPMGGDSTHPQASYSLVISPADDYVAITDRYDPAIGDSGLDHFDAALLDSVYEPIRNFDPNVPARESLALEPFWSGNSRPPTAYNSFMDEAADDPGHQKATREVLKTGPEERPVMERRENRRPQLLRPSEDQPQDPEPFTGFSRPWVLY